MEELGELRAGLLGLFSLNRVEPDPEDNVLGRGAVWTSLTDYLPTRHPRRGQDAREAVADDLLLEANRRGLPRPSVEVLKLDVGVRGGLRASLRLRFATAITGPVLLGQGSHFGLGLFGRSLRVDDIAPSA